MLGGGGGMTSAQHAAFSNMGGGAAGTGLFGLGAGATAFGLTAPLLAYYGISSIQSDESPAETRAQQVQAGQVFNQAKDFIIEHGRVPGPEDGWGGNIDHLLRMMAPGGGGGISATYGADLQPFGNGVPNEVLGRAFNIHDPAGDVVLNYLAQNTDPTKFDPGVQDLIKQRNIDTTPSVAYDASLRRQAQDAVMQPGIYGDVSPLLQITGRDGTPVVEMSAPDENGVRYPIASSMFADEIGY